MNDWAAPPSADRLPTLTEVVDLDPAPQPTLADADAVDEALAVPSAEPSEAGIMVATPEAAVHDGAWPPAGPEAVEEPVSEPLPAPLVSMEPADPPSPPVVPVVDTQAVVALALAELQPRLDMLLESRLRAALAPALARAAEGLIDEARGGLATVLHELVQDAVQRALQRQAARLPGAEALPPHRP